ncbi:hypothetical protein SUGI_1068700 [Cryptomeria japonica]|uniref:uncharacterized protein LOC131073389 n=1 Tax=Cryptomeria japonica TaxID=3369 RepID=UPI002414CF58|nr:uncharacterized protein LOC131073389 [Cryptomeria japonica]GLJ50210.1 hypothetical protein SUGI_1068700 [Cryptomeria japonica]
MEKVSVWWDMDSCPLPSQMDPFVVSSMAKKSFENFNIGDGSEIGHQFNAYKYPSEKEGDIELGQTMVNSGINLQLIHPGNSNEIEKMIMVDVLLWAMDVPQPGDIIFIVGNVDFSYLFHKLQERSFNVFLVCVSVDQMPYDMLTAANDCLEWLTLLELSGQNEEKLQFSSILHGCPEHHQDFSNTYSSSASTVSNSTKEWEDNQNISNYITEDSLTDQLSFNNEWEDNRNMSNFSYIPEDSFSGQSSFTNEWDLSPFSIPPLNESATVTRQQPQSPGFQEHGNQSTGKPMDPAETKHRNWKSPPITGPKKASVHEFKAWFSQALNCKERESGYNILYICMEFENATGKILDFNIMNLLQQCKDIAEVKEVKKGLHLAFPVKTNKQKPFKTRKPNPNPKPKIGKPENPSSGVNCNPNLQTNRKRNSNPKAKAKAKSEAEQKSKTKASAADFHDFLLHMVNTGEFSQGFPMSQIHKRFESVSGKCLDIQYLGYQELIDLIKVYGSPVAVDETRQGQLRLYPAGFPREIISNSYFSTKNEEFPVNKVKNVANHEAKLEMNRPYTGGGFQSPQNKAWKDIS